MKFILVPLAAISLLIACAPVISQRGYVADPANEGTIKTGADTKTSVQSRLGYASTTATSAMTAGITSRPPRSRLPSSPPRC